MRVYIYTHTFDYFCDSSDLISNYIFCIQFEISNHLQMISFVTNSINFILQPLNDLHGLDLNLFFAKKSYQD